MIDLRLVFAALVLASICLMPHAFAQEKTGTLDVYIKNEKNERVAPEGISFKIFKNQEKTPLQESAVQNNPFAIPSLPLGHNYRLELYANNLYADTAFIDLQKSQIVEIPIKNAGGLLLNIYYKDNETPIEGAKVWIKSDDGKSWSYSETAKNGQTIRAWLYPTTRADDFYYAEIFLEPNIKYVHTPIKLEPGIAQDFKVVTKWPALVDSLFTVEIYNTTKTKVTKQDGTFIAQLYDSKKNKIADSAVTEKGTAYFSKLKIGNYALYIKEKDATGQLKTVAGKKVTVSEDTRIIKVYLHNPELNSDNLNCNCVAFRLDDIQDYYLAPAQLEILSLFEEKNVPLTLGVIAGITGSDQKIVTAIKNDLAGNTPVEIANHSWRHNIYPKMTKINQETDFKRANEKIYELFGVTPTTFIPPENQFNNDTISVLKAGGIKQISYGETGPTEGPPKFLKSDFYHFPMFAYTAKLNPNISYWEPQSNEQTFERINDSLFNYGYAVVMLHPYEFSNYENGGYVNTVNATMIQDLGLLIDKLKSENIRILTIGSIPNYDAPPPTKPAPSQNQEAPSCNCVAFRLDNIQDFWINDVQSTVVETFAKNDVPLTVTILGKFIGDDPKTVEMLKEQLQNKKIKLASRGWEYTDHTAFDKERQMASIAQTNDKILKVFGTRPTVFSPPYDAFNKDTLDAAKQSKIIYFSANIANDKPPFANDYVRHAPSTASFENLVSDDPFYAGTIPQKALAKVQSSLKQHGFAVISLQPSDFAVKTDAFKNEVNTAKLALLESLLADLNANGIRAVPLESISTVLDDRSTIIPDWIKNNAGWWAEGKINDSDFTKGLEYLIEQQIIKIPETQKGESTGKKIPDWIKTNADWWAQGKIGNSDFVKGIQYLIQNGIIAV